MKLSRMNRQRSSSHVVFGDVDYPKQGAFGPRVQGDYQLVTVYAGEASIEVNGEPVFVPEQHSILLSPGNRERFAFAKDRATRHTWCAVHPSLVNAELEAALSSVRDTLPPSSRITNLIEYGLSFPSGPEADAVLEVLGLTLLRVVMFEASHRADRHVPRAVTRAKLFMETRLSENLELNDIARAVNVTPQHLTRLFRQHLNVTPMRFLWQTRTRHGVELLGSTGLAINVIAAQTGFQSAFHFSRLVKERTGHSPRALRQGLWRGEKFKLEPDR
jgi:AraC-like DNA-binding protein